MKITKNIAIKILQYFTYLLGYDGYTTVYNHHNDKYEIAFCKNNVIESFLRLVHPNNHKDFEWIIHKRPKTIDETDIYVEILTKIFNELVHKGSICAISEHRTLCTLIDKDENLESILMRIDMEYVILKQK